MRVIGYVRVSTKGQAERYGPAEQDRDIRAWCKAHGHKLLRVEVEQASGKRGADGGEDYGVDTPEARPVLSAILAAVEAGEAAGVVVGRIDRLARSVMWQEIVQHKLAAKGGQVCVVNADADGLDEMTRQLLRQMLGAIAQYEHALIVARLQGGRRAKHARGGYAYGSPRYGLVSHRPAPNIPSVLVKDKGEQAGIKRIRELDAAGLSSHRIAATLNAEEIPAKRGGPWHSVTVLRVIQRNGDTLNEQAR